MTRIPATKRRFFCSRGQVLSVLLASLASTISNAQTFDRSTRLTVDNDYFDFLKAPDKRADDNYTHGARISFDLHRSPQLVHQTFCAVQKACVTTIEIGQEIYTPTRGDVLPVPGE